MNALKLAAISAAVAFGLSSAVRASQEDILSPPIDHICAPAPAAVSIANSLPSAIDQRSLQEVAQHDVVVNPIGGRFAITAGAAKVYAPIAGDAVACRASAPRAVRLFSGGSMPGAEWASLLAVLAYRTSHHWPYGDADLSAPRTAIDIQTRGAHVLVSISDYKTLFSKNAVNCSGEESYRVDPTKGFSVIPYGQCGEFRPGPNGPLRRLKDIPN